MIIDNVITSVVRCIDLLSNVEISWNGYTIDLVTAAFTFTIFCKLISIFLAGFTAFSGSGDLGDDSE